MLTSCNTQGVTSHVTDNGKEFSESVQTEDSRPEEVNITFEGGSGKAYIESPVTVTYKDGKSYATLVWSSDKYDYIIVDGVRYENENPGGKSTFTIPVSSFLEPLDLIGDTTAMSKPHEIEYRIIWSGPAGEGDFPEEEAGDDGAAFGIRPAYRSLPLIDGKKSDGALDLKYANGFDVTYYGPYRLISIYGVGEYLLIPADAKIPEISFTDGSEAVDITIIQGPVESTYLVSTSAMDLVDGIERLGKVRFSPLRAEDWHLEHVRDVMESGRMLYAGKYRMPDYELLLSNGCDLAIENTMIYHNPEVKEKLEELGIPVIVETSSYESDPLGRLEWIKLYGELYDSTEAADRIFDEQEKIIDSQAVDAGKGKKVAFFYVSATGMIVVRAPGDYITKMIGMTGATYVPESGSVSSKGGMGSINMQPEDFYSQAADADILIYNSTIDGEVGSLDDLIGRSPVFSDFKAVSEGNVYCLSGDFFQKSTGLSDFVTDMCRVVSGSEGEYTFLTKLQ